MAAEAVGGGEQSTPDFWPEGSGILPMDERPPPPALRLPRGRRGGGLWGWLRSRMVLNKVLELFCVKKKDSKKKVAAPHPTANVSTNNSLLDPFSTGNGTVLSVQKHEPECSSVISSMTRTEYGFESDGCNLFSHFDVVQDFSDHYYAKNSPGKTSKDWVKTIQNEWRLLQKDLPESIYVRVYEDRIDLLRAAIVGPAETPYHDGLFFFDVCFPSEYPQSHRLTHVHIPSLMSYESPMHACHGKWSSIPSSLTGASPELVHRLIPDHIRQQHGLNLRMLGVRMAP
uniref:UBC core domain-containing protein n=1 Tax=Oryza barthii TaxID=65489 RepID=A0A0D3FME7_9ORYZ